MRPRPRRQPQQRRRRAAYRGSVAAAVGAFAAGVWPGLSPLTDW